MFRIRNKGSDVSQETIEDDISQRRCACISMSSLSCYCDYQPGNQAILRVHQIHMGLEDSALSMSQLVCCNLICLFVSSLNHTIS